MYFNSSALNLCKASSPSSKVPVQSFGHFCDQAWYQLASGRLDSYACYNLFFVLVMFLPRSTQGTVLVVHLLVYLPSTRQLLDLCPAVRKLYY